ncbi:MAG: hypothetical protein ABMA14_17150, partial [Hyphomonadaceae bacterium]
MSAAERGRLQGFWHELAASARRMGLAIAEGLDYPCSMTLTFDFYFSFRSPYSYLAMPMIEQLQAQYDAAATMRIVRPIAVRIPGFFQKVNPLWPPYLMRDTWRIAEMNGIPYR